MRALALMALITFGCGPTSDDHVELAHRDFCWSECPYASSQVRGDSVAAGARYVIEVDNTDRLPPFTVSTSDDSVLTVASALSLDEADAERPGLIVLDAGAPGSARLFFTDVTARTVIDEVEITVLEVASIRRFRAADRAPLLMRGGTYTSYVEAHGAGHEPLLGYGAIEYTATTGVTVESARAQAAVWDATEVVVAWPESVRVTGAALGVAAIEARAGDAALSFDLEVVEESAVTRIELSPDWSGFGFGLMTAHAFDAEGVEIHDPECRWTWDDGGIYRLVNTTRNTISLGDDGDDGDDDVGSLEVTCWIGEVSGSTWL